MRAHTARAEHLIGQENMARVRQGLDSQFARMEAIVTDYARWDDAYQFVLDGNRKFYEANLIDSTFGTMHADVVIFLRSDGKAVFATGFDEKKTKKTALPRGISEFLRPEGKFLSLLKQHGGKCSGWLALPVSQMFVEVRPVTHSDGSGPVRGYLFLGSFWNDQKRRKLEQSVNLGLTMTPSIGNAPQLEEVESHLRAQDSIFVQSNNETMSSYAFVNDVFGQPAFLIRADGRRDLFHQEEVALRSLKWSLLAVGFAFCLAMLAKMDLLVLRRVRLLVGDLQAIRHHADSGPSVARVRVAGRDELGRLANQINLTLDALHDAHRQYERTVANVPGVVARMVVGPDGRHNVTFVSDESRKILRVEAATLLNNPRLFAESIHPDDLAEFKRSCRHSLQSLEDWNWIGRVRQGEDKYIWVQGMARAESLKQGGVAWDGLLLDVTDRKSVEESLKLAHDEMEQRVAMRTGELSQANRLLTGEIVERQMIMATLHETVEQLEKARTSAENANRAKSDFLSRMSHELRTPLNAIIGFAQLLETDVQSDDDKESVGQILDAGRHLLILINEVLDIASIEAGRLSISLEPVPVEDIIEEAIALVRPLAEPQKIAVLFTGGVLREGGAIPVACRRGQYVLGDRQRLKQVLLNLLSNAVKYNHSGGQVRVEFTVENERVRISVRDTGIGIAPDKIARLFTPFDRLGAESTKVEGMGIGLVLSKGLVELMNGRMGFESEAEQGSTFWIEFAAALAPELSRNKAPRTKSNLEFSSRTILYIEDNLPNLRLVQRSLERMPELTLLTATHAAKGLELAHLHHPDLILLDVHLPDFNGDVVLSRLKSNPATHDIPVVIISADATKSNIQALLAAGAAAYLTKPLDLEQFFKVTHEILYGKAGQS